MRRSLTALTAVAVVLLAACGEDDGGDEQADASTQEPTAGGEPDSVTVGVIPIVDVAPIYLGIEQGFFEEQNIDVTLESGQGGAAIVPGVVSGEFQFGFSNVTSLLIARTEGLDLKVVTAGNSTTGEEGADFGAVVVREDSDIQDAADLAGRSVAVNTLNNIGTSTINKVVRDAGGDPSTINYTELAFPDMPAALQDGQVDAVWVVEPFLTISTQQGARPVAWNFAGTDPNLMIAAYFTTQELIDSNPELVERFTTAMTESLEYADSNPDEARRILSTYTQIDEATAEALTLPKWPTEIATETVQLLADLAVEDGLVDTEPDVDALLP
ncbi:MAG TPA: ABC transporter substrate-binding protein [Jiangellaceae bacterium]|nr:ABC transporter substrate-binding protein [Jiangellaceae bacterium]